MHENSPNNVSEVSVDTEKLNDATLKMRNTPKNFEGGKLSQNITKWRTLTTDQWILKTIHGCALELNEEPEQNIKPHPIRLTQAEQSGLDAEIDEFIRHKIVEPCEPDEAGSFYSNLFTKEKKDGSIRVIFNLKKTNPTFGELPL